MEELEIIANEMRITDSVIEGIEDSVGKGSDGWDFVDPEKLVRACWVAFAKQVKQNTRYYVPKMIDQN